MINVIHHRIALALNVLKAHQKAMTDIEDSISDCCARFHIDFVAHKMGQGTPNWLTFNGLDWSDFPQKPMDFDQLEKLRAMILYRNELITTIKSKNNIVVALNSKL